VSASPAVAATHRSSGGKPTGGGANGGRPSGGTAAGQLATSDLPFPSAPIEDMLKLLTKGVRAHQLYMHNNPTYLKALEALRASFTPIWEYTDDFALQITEGQFLWEDTPVLTEDGKTSESLPWTFYKDGVRELRFAKGFEASDLEPFLDVVQRARRNSPDEDDLLVMLWEQELHQLRYRYVDLSSDTPGAATLESRFEPHVVEPPTADDPPLPEESLLLSRPGVVNLDDFDSTLYFLDEKEVEYLKEEVSKEYASDLRSNVLAILLDVFEAQSDMAVRDEITRILDNLMLHLLSARQYSAVAFLLREAQTAATRATNLVAGQRDKLANVFDRLSESEALSQLLQSLDETRELPRQDALNDLFEQLRPYALGTVFSWLARIQEPRLKALLETAAGRLIAANTAELVRLIGSPDQDIAIQAMQRAGALRSAGAVAPLIKRMLDGSPEIRLASVLALAEIGSAGALQALERAIDDADRDVRVATARAVAARAYRPALARVETVVRGKALREADLTEKMAMFEAYGALCGDGGVPLLDGILNGKGFLGKRDDADHRACAAIALGRVGTEHAIEALRRATNEKEIVVRNAVNKVLRGGTVAAQ
jgi:HEAT repeat protein